MTLILPRKNDYIHAAYLDIMSPEVLVKRANAAVVQLESRQKDDGLEFDTLAFCGMSGALFAPMLALKLRKHLIMVRKASDRNGGGRGIVNHSEYATEGFTACKKYLFVDDLISLGNTVRHVVHSINDFAPDAECVGAYLYIQNEFQTLRCDYDWRFKDLFQSDAKRVPAVALADDPTVCVNDRYWFDPKVLTELRKILGDTTPSWPRPSEPVDPFGIKSMDATNAEEPATISEVPDVPPEDIPF